MKCAPATSSLPPSSTVRFLQVTCVQQGLAMCRSRGVSGQPVKAELSERVWKPCGICASVVQNGGIKVPPLTPSSSIVPALSQLISENCGTPVAAMVYMVNAPDFLTQMDSPSTKSLCEHVSPGFTLTGTLGTNII